MRLLYTFDIDGVLANTAPMVIKLFNKRFNKNKKVNELNEFFIMYKWLKEILQDEKLATDEAVKLWNDEDVLYKSRPTKGAVEVVTRLLNDSHDVHFVTSRPNCTKEVTLKWINKWFPFVKDDSLHISSKTDGLQRQFKSEVIRILQPHVHFEDSIEHIQDILKASPKTKIVLVRQPWNLKNEQENSESIIVPNKYIRSNLLVSYEYYKATLYNFD